jgi:hypothetical protein
VRPVAALQGIEAAAAKSINWAVQEEVLHKRAGCGVTHLGGDGSSTVGNDSYGTQFKIPLWRMGRVYNALRFRSEKEILA